jgi:hypothetical protein
MIHRSKHGEIYKPTEADTPLAYTSDDSISYYQNQFFAQVPRVLAQPLRVWPADAVETCVYNQWETGWKVNNQDWSSITVMLGLHGDILKIRLENIADIIANCLCVNRVDSSVAGIP